jgi:hypothetical protein
VEDFGAIMAVFVIFAKHEHWMNSDD